MANGSPRTTQQEDMMAPRGTAPRLRWLAWLARNSGRWVAAEAYEELGEGTAALLDRLERIADLAQADGSSEIAHRVYTEATHGLYVDGEAG